MESLDTNTTVGVPEAAHHRHQILAASLEAAAVPLELMVEESITVEEPPILTGQVL
jgi:hypothetical protein